MTSAVNSVLSSLLGNSSSTASSSSSGTSGSSSSSSSSSSTSSSANTSAYELSLSEAAQNQNTINLLGNLQSLGQEFSSTALGLATAQVNSNVSSSNTNIAGISEVTNNNYAVDVSQLATAQTLTSSTTFSSSSATLGTTGDSLVLQLGDWNGTSFTTAGSAATTITIGTNSLTGIANSINAAKAGVSATLVSVSGGVELKLTGETTGAFSGFSLSASSDLSDLEYNGTTNSMSLTQAAVDASYTVNGSLYTSPTNSAVPVTTGVDINLAKVGSVMISQTNAPTQLVANAQSLVSYVNNLIQGIGQVQSSLGTNDAGTCSEFVNALTQVGYQSLNGTNSLTTLSDIGLNVQPDGTIQFNETTFTTAYGNDPTNASFVLSQAAIQYATISDQYAGSNGSIQNKINNLNELQVALVYGSQADAAAAQGTAQTTSSQYGATSNPWAGVNFYQG